MKREIFQKVVQWESGKNIWVAFLYFTLIIIAVLIMDQPFWKEILVMMTLLVAGTLVNEWQLPKRRVYWVKLRETKK